jgi:hypothetical protein
MLIFALLLCGPLLACEAPEDVTSTSASSEAGDTRQRLSEPLSAAPGERWGPCLTDDLWGCDGVLGEGLACLRPVSDVGLNICAPQTWDPEVDDDCGNADDAPFGLGVRLKGSAYCVPDCEIDADCGEGRACSPASHYCAWVGD